MKKQEKIYILMVLALGLSAGVFAGLQGCTANVPSLAFYPVPPTPTPACVPVLLNGAESLTENGNWTGANASKSLVPLNATQGSTSLDVNITTAAGWNDNFLLLDSFAPNVWSPYTQLLADAYVEPGVVAGASYTQLLLFADSPGNGQYYIQISSTIPNLAAGQQTIIWTLDFPNSLISTMALANIRFIYNNSASPGTGHIYLDNLRFCP